MDTRIDRRQLTVGTRALSYLAAGPLPDRGAMAPPRGADVPPGAGRVPVRLAVFLHAFPLEAEMWAPQLRALPGGWAAVAPDFRGFGGSDPDGDRPLREDARLEDYADDVAWLLDALGAGRAAVCGCSMGGYAAFALLRRFPGRVSGLLLADTRTAADSEAARASRAAALDLLDRDGPAAVAAEMRPKLVGPTSQRERPGVVAAIDGLMSRATARGIGHAVCRLRNRPDAAADLAAFRGPVSVVVGDEDTLTPPAEAEAMAAVAAGASFVRIPGAGHISNLESPDAFNAAMLDWLDRVAAKTP